MGWLEGDVALISRAGSGLGRALVDRFDAEGARVVAFDRNPERVAAAEGSYDGTVLGVVGDVTVAGDNERAVTRALSAFGRLDTFIGNAGLFDYGARLVDTPIASYAVNAVSRQRWQRTLPAAGYASDRRRRGRCRGQRYRRNRAASPRYLDRSRAQDRDSDRQPAAAAVAYQVELRRGPQLDVGEDPP
jgi:NAD(P)-dependent dehydrogenase (short-subunit alcohol dehydrogenase family)